MMKQTIQLGAHALLRVCLAIGIFQLAQNLGLTKDH